MKKSILAEAVDRWPEDEAYGLWCDLIAGDSPASDAQIAHHITHMRAVFSSESDGAELIARFDRKLSGLRGERP